MEYDLLDIGLSRRGISETDLDRKAKEDRICSRAGQLYY